MLKYEEMQDAESCFNRAARYEMIFVLLGRDLAAPAAIRAWIDERIRIRKNVAGDPQIINALKCAIEMEREQAAYARKHD